MFLVFLIGILTGWLIWILKPVRMIVETTILKEKEECKKQGGLFDVWQSLPNEPVIIKCFRSESPFIFEKKL